jgi:hypothetical protein
MLPTSYPMLQTNFVTSADILWIHFNVHFFSTFVPCILILSSSLFIQNLPYYLRFLTLFVVFLGGWLGYVIAGFVFSDNLFSIHFYGISSFYGSM